MCDSKENLKEWIRGTDKKINCRDIITDHDCMAGFEANLTRYVGVDWPGVLGGNSHS